MTADDLLADGAVGIEGAGRFSGVGRTLLYKLMGKGRLPFVKAGTRRLIPRRALDALLSQGFSGDMARRGDGDWRCPQAGANHR